MESLGCDLSFERGTHRAVTCNDKGNLERQALPGF